MKPITEYDHPEHHWKWTKLELDWINARIKAERAEERKRCANRVDSYISEYNGLERASEVIRALGDE